MGAPFIEAVEDGQFFHIVNFIIAFGGEVLFRVKGYWVEKAVLVILRYDPGGDVVRAVGFHDNFPFGIEVHEDRGGRESQFEGLEQGSSFQRPLKLDAFLEEGRERGDHEGVPLNEPALKIGKTKKRLDIFNRSWGGRFLDCRYFGGVHGDTVSGDDYS